MADIMDSINDLFNFFDTEDERKKFNERQKKQRDKETNDVKKLLDIPEGRRFFWRLLSGTGVFRTSMTGNSQTFFNEGRRDIGLMILKDVMEANPGAFSQMQREFISARNSEVEKQKENNND